MGDRLRTIFCFTTATLAASLVCGCTICMPSKNGTTHHLVIGLGIVSVNESPENAVIITDTAVLGVSISDRPGLKLGVGYASGFVMTVPDNAEDVRAEITRVFCGPMMVTIPRARLANYSTQRSETHEADN